MSRIETERLILRRFVQEDLNEFAAICADRDVMRYASLTGKPLKRIQAWNWMAQAEGHWQLRGYGMWAVEEKSTQHLIGRIGLQFMEDFPDIEAAWLLGKPFWGQGYALEGARAAIKYGFRKLGKESFISMIFPQNTPSIRLAERLGEVRDGEITLHGQRLLVYRINKKDFADDQLAKSA